MDVGNLEPVDGDLSEQYLVDQYLVPMGGGVKFCDFLSASLESSGAGKDRGNVWHPLR